MGPVPTTGPRCATVRARGAGSPAGNGPCPDHSPTSRAGRMPSPPAVKSALQNMSLSYTALQVQRANREAVKMSGARRPRREPDAQRRPARRECLGWHGGPARRMTRAALSGTPSTALVAGRHGRTGPKPACAADGGGKHAHGLDAGPQSMPDRAAQAETSTAGATGAAGRMASREGTAMDRQSQPVLHGSVWRSNWRAKSTPTDIPGPAARATRAKGALITSRAAGPSWPARPQWTGPGRNAAPP